MCEFFVKCVCVNLPSYTALYLHQGVNAFRWTWMYDFKMNSIDEIVFIYNVWKSGNTVSMLEMQYYLLWRGSQLLIPWLKQMSNHLVLFVTWKLNTTHYISYLYALLCSQHTHWKKKLKNCWVSREWKDECHISSQMFTKNHSC